MRQMPTEVLLFVLRLGKSCKTVLMILNAGEDVSRGGQHMESFNGADQG